MEIKSKFDHFNINVNFVREIPYNNYQYLL